MIFDLSSWSTIKVSGPDRSKYLNGIVTLEISSLGKQQWYRSTILTPKGKIRSIFWIKEFGDHYLIVCPDKLRDNLIVDLLKYRINVDVKLEDLTDELPSLVFSEGDSNVSGLGSFSGNFEHGGSSTATEEEFNALITLNNSCVPHILFDYNPLEVGLFDAISLNKGCFLGQEPLSRMYNRGRPRFFLALLESKSDEYTSIHSFLYKSKIYFITLVPYSLRDSSDVTPLGYYPDFKRV